MAKLPVSTKLPVTLDAQLVKAIAKDDHLPQTKNGSPLPVILNRPATLHLL